MSIPYFPFYANDWLDDENIFDMGLECEGAYIRLLAAMWKRDGYIPDKQNWCCNVLRCRPAKWRKIRAVLMELGVIKLENERFFNERMIKELFIFNEKSQKNSENAHKRWDKVSKNVPKKPNKNNDTNNANALKTQCHTDTDTDTDIKEKNKRKNTTTLKKLIKSDWQPSDRCLELIQDAGVDVSFATGLIKEFIFYWEQQGVKRPGWDTTFLNHSKKQWGFNQNEKSKQYNQSSKNQKLEKTNQELFDRARQLEREVELEEKRSGLFETLDAPSNALSAAEF